MHFSIGILFALFIVGFCELAERKSSWLLAPDWNDVLLYKNLNRTTTKQHSSVSCARQCENNKACEYFIFEKNDGGTCHLYQDSLPQFGDVADNKRPEVLGAKCYIKATESCRLPRQNSENPQPTYTKPSNGTMSFDMAVDYCKNLNCSLAAPRDMAGVGNLTEVDSSHAFWLGIRYSNECHNFLYIEDNTVFDYRDTLWKAGHPSRILYRNSPLKRDDCVMLNPLYTLGLKPDFKFTSWSCDASFKTICECNKDK